MENSRELNPMCTTCARCGADCTGTTETVWTGCALKVSIQAAQQGRKANYA